MISILAAIFILIMSPCQPKTNRHWQSPFLKIKFPVFHFGSSPELPSFTHSMALSHPSYVCIGVQSAVSRAYVNAHIVFNPRAEQLLL